MKIYIQNKSVKYFILICLLFFMVFTKGKAFSQEIPLKKTDRSPSIPGKGLKNKIIFKAKEFEIDGIKNIIYARGGVKIYEEKMFISGREAIYYQDKKMADVIGQVNMTYRKFKVRCQKAKLYGYGDKKIEALEGVVFTYQNINGKSNIAIFYPRDKKVVLQGNASAVTRGNRLTGEEIVVYLEEKRIISHGNTSIVITKK